MVVFAIPGRLTTTTEFAEATNEILDQLPGTQVVLINGRGPIWAYAMLVHAAHPAPAVATYDPRPGYIIVTMHDARYALGRVLGFEASA